jgi:hypothetical protein
MDKKSVYAAGLYFNTVDPKTLDEVKKWKKGSIAIHKAKFMEQLATLEANEKGYIKFDLTRNEKDGEVFFSFKLNEWKPEKKDIVDPISPEDMPF